MIIKTAGGDELNADMITLNEMPKSFSFRLSTPSAHDILGILYNETLAPVEGYEEFTELESFRVDRRGSVMVSLRAKDNEVIYTPTTPRVVTDAETEERTEEQ